MDLEKVIQTRVAYLPERAKAIIPRTAREASRFAGAHDSIAVKKRVLHKPSQTLRGAVIRMHGDAINAHTVYGVCSRS